MLRLSIVFLLLLMLLDTALAKSSFVPKSFEANFMQIAKSAISDKETKIELNVKYQFPKKFYLKQGGNDTTIYVCNSKKVWVYKPPFVKGMSGELTIGKKSDLCYSKIFDSLKFGLKSNKTYKVKKLNEKSYELSFLNSLKTRLGLEKLVLNLKSKTKKFENLKSLDLYYEGEKSPVVLNLLNLKKVKSFSKKTFDFIPPKNTNITNL